MSALASLTADYTDSEDEDDRKEEEDDANGGEQEEPFQQDRPASGLADRIRDREIASAGAGGSASGTPGTVSNPASARSTPTKVTRLVSYAEEGAQDDDDGNKDDEAEQEDNSGASAVPSGKPAGGAKEESDADVVSMDLDSDNAGFDTEDDKKDEEEAAKAGAKSDAAPAVDRVRRESQSGVAVEAWTGGVKLPPEPAGLCDPKLQQRINEMYRRKRERGYDMNAFIQNKKSFRNPSIYEKLIQFCDIDEMGTNFPKELYDGHLFGKESFYDELAKVQAADMDKREKAAKARGAAALAAVRAPSDAGSRRHDGGDGTRASGKPRRSKWDQGAPASTSSLPSAPMPSRPTTGALPLPNKPAPELVSAGAAAAAPQVVSASASGKTISAFGPLKK